MLEDLGFSQIPVPARRASNQEMTYHYHLGGYSQRIYADINSFVVVELFLQSVELSLDKWWFNHKHGLYMAVDDIDFNLCDPLSINLVSSYIENAISECNMNEHKVNRKYMKVDTDENH